jgi:hypothetical protein
MIRSNLKNSFMTATKWSTTSSVMSACLSLAVLFSFESCDLFTPDAYSESENNITSFDSRACSFMTRDFIHIDTVYSGSDTTVINDTLYIAIQAHQDDFTELFDSLVFEANSEDVTQLSALFDSIATESGMITRDTTNLVELNEGSEYLYFNNNSGGEHTVFVSWAFNANNVSDYVSIDFVNRSGIQAEVSTQDMPLSTISGCTVEYLANEETGEISDTPAIKTRVTFKLDSNPYVMRVKRTQFIAGSIKVPLYLAILQND